MSELHDVENALDLLRAAFIGRNPRIADDTAQVWHYSLSRFTGPVLISAATSWPQHNDDLPTVNQFVHECQSAARALALQEERIGERGSKVCPDCHGARWVEDSANTVRPCGRCIPATKAKWQGGEYAPRFVAAGADAATPEQMVAGLAEARRVLTEGRARLKANPRRRNPDVALNRSVLDAQRETSR